MAHPLITQLRFARTEFQRGLEGVTDEEARRRFMPMNCLSWNVGHLAWQEQRYWLHIAQGKMPFPEVQETYRFGAPAATPALDEVWAFWKAITTAADPWLDAVTNETLLGRAWIEGWPDNITFGSLILRTTYHYWYHNGENQAIRQVLGHTNLPVFVGNIDGEAPYRP